MQEITLSVHILGAIIGVASSLALIIYSKTNYRIVMIASNGFAVITGVVLAVSTNVSIVRSCAFGIALATLAIIGEARHRATHKVGTN